MQEEFLCSREGTRVRIFRVGRFLEKRPLLRNSSLRATVPRDDTFGRAAAAVARQGGGGAALSRDHSLRPAKRRDSFGTAAARVAVAGGAGLARDHSLRAVSLRVSSSQSTVDDGFLPEDEDMALLAAEADAALAEGLRESSLARFTVAEVRLVASFLPLQAKWAVCATCRVFRLLVDEPDEDLFWLAREHSWQMDGGLPQPWSPALPPLGAGTGGYRVALGGLVLARGRGAGRLAVEGVLRKGVAQRTASVAEVTAGDVIPFAALSERQRTDVEVALGELRGEWA